MPDRLTLRGLRGAHAGPFDLTLSRGACAAVTGPSGAGKSLLLRMIADLDPSEGEVLLDCRDRTAIPAPAWRGQVVYCAAEPGWWSEQVADHFPAGTLMRAIDLAVRVGLTAAHLESPVARLSTGERQRLALLRALVLDPPVLLLDEPTGALDEASTARVENVLAERLRTGTSILLVTHAKAQAERMGTVRLSIAQGRFAA